MVPGCFLLDDASLCGEAHELRGAVEVQLLENVRAVSLDRGWADTEELGHLPVGMPLRDELEHFTFTRRQPIEWIAESPIGHATDIFVDQMVDDWRAEERATRRDHGHRPDEFRVRGVLQQVTLGASP